MKTERPPRAAARGVLTRLAKGAPARKRRDSFPRRLLRWTGQGLAVGLMAALAGLALYAMFRPAPPATVLEGDFPIEAIEAPASNPEAAATLTVHIRGRRVEIPVSGERRRGLEPGGSVHVRYTYFPRVGRVRVESWEPASR